MSMANLKNVFFQKNKVNSVKNNVFNFFQIGTEDLHILNKIDK